MQQGKGEGREKGKSLPAGAGKPENMFFGEVTARSVR